MSILNRLIGASGVFLGGLLVATGISWLIIQFRSDFQQFVGDLPLLGGPLNLPVFGTMILWGAFCVLWGTAMLKRKEWGALMAGMVHTLLLICLVAGGAFMFQLLRDPAIIALVGDNRLAFYHRWFWLIWGLYLIVLLITVAITTWLVAGSSRRALYAIAHQTNPPPLQATCPRCGLLLEDGKCRDCSSRLMAYISIGSRQEAVEFINDEASGSQAVLIGRKGKFNPRVQIYENEVTNLQSISSPHVRIEYHFDTQSFTVEDLSTNGTRLNGEPLDKHTPVPLNYGDTISLAQEVNVRFMQGLSR